MWGSISRYLLIIGLAGLVVLSACERTSSEGGVDLTHTPETEIQSQQGTIPGDVVGTAAYPAPGSDNPQIFDQSRNHLAYPDSNVESAVLNGTSGTPPAYPAPDMVDPAQSTPLDGAYPAPAENIATQAPEITASSTKSATNIPATPTPLPTQHPLLTLTQLSQNPTQVISSTQVITVTQTVTPSLVRTQLEASDPSTFELASGQVQLVEFFAFWSPMSQSMAPVIFRLEDRYKDRIKFVYLDIDDPANDLFKQLIDDRLPPIYYLLDGGGNVLDEWDGYVFEEMFISAIEAVIQ